jgi:hypothetical protein
VRYEQGLKKRVNNTASCNRAELDGSTPTDNIKPWFSLKKNKGPKREAVK